jgi:hypothetical protein
VKQGLSGGGKQISGSDRLVRAKRAPEIQKNAINFHLAIVNPPSHQVFLLGSNIHCLRGEHG